MAWPPICDTESSPTTATVLIYDDIDWDRPLAAKSAAERPPKELVEAAKKTGARRKKLARGEAGFYMNRSILPSEFRVPPHTHNHSELLVILRGGCTFDEGVAELSQDDSIVITANFRYGFTVGSEGMEFLTIRMGEASVTLTD